jgi:hypothetical protein
VGVGGKPDGGGELRGRRWLDNQWARDRDWNDDDLPPVTAHQISARAGGRGRGGLVTAGSGGDRGGGRCVQMAMGKSPSGMDSLDPSPW